MIKDLHHCSSREKTEALGHAGKRLNRNAFKKGDSVEGRVEADVLEFLDELVKGVDVQVLFDFQLLVAFVDFEFVNIEVNGLDFASGHHSFHEVSRLEFEIRGSLEGKEERPPWLPVS